jgi:hypothetical protein
METKTFTRVQRKETIDGLEITFNYEYEIGSTPTAININGNEMGDGINYNGTYNVENSKVNHQFYNSDMGKSSVIITAIENIIYDIVASGF